MAGLEWAKRREGRIELMQCRRRPALSSCAAVDWAEQTAAVVTVSVVAAESTICDGCLVAVPLLSVACTSPQPTAVRPPAVEGLDPCHVGERRGPSLALESASLPQHQQSVVMDL